MYGLVFIVTYAFYIRSKIFDLSKAWLSKKLDIEVWWHNFQGMIL